MLLPSGLEPGSVVLELEQVRRLRLQRLQHRLPCDRAHWQRQRAGRRGGREGWMEGWRDGGMEGGRWRHAGVRAVACLSWHVPCGA
jgi:hypothetical protein